MPIIEPGTHRVKVIDSALAESSNGNEQIVVKFGREEDGATITGYFFMTEKSWKYTRMKLVAMGWDPAKNDYDVQLLNGPDSPILDAEVDIVVNEEEYTYKGETRRQLRVQFVNPPGGGALRNRMDDDRARDFTKRLRSAIETGEILDGDEGEDTPF